MQNEDAKQQPSDYPFQAVSFEQVKIDDREVTVRYDLRKCEKTGRIENFSKADKQLAGPFVGGCLAAK